MVKQKKNDIHPGGKKKNTYLYLVYESRQTYIEDMFTMKKK